MEIKKFVLFALIPAFIAGFFTLAPKLYDVWTAPKFNLNYQIQSGAVVEEDSGRNRAIISVQIENTGTQIINDIEGFLTVKNFEIETMSIEDSNKLEAKLSKRPDKSVLVSFKSLYPGQKLNISLLVKGSDQIINPNFVLRSKEGLGKIKSGEKNSKYSESDFISVALTFLSVFIMFFYGVFKIAKGEIPFSLYRVINGKPEFLFFILTRAGLFELAMEISRRNIGISYLSVSDLITGYAINNPLYKLNGIKSLKALLCIKDIAESSKEIIRDNLKLLDNMITDDEIDNIEKNSISITNSSSLPLRQKIIEVIK